MMVLGERWSVNLPAYGSQKPSPPGVTRSQANCAGLKALVDAGKPPGLIGYRGKVPVGWVSQDPMAQLTKRPEAASLGKNELHARPENCGSSTESRKSPTRSHNIRPHQTGHLPDVPRGHLGIRSQRNEQRGHHDYAQTEAHLCVDDRIAD